MKQSYKFFQNRECEYFPCHEMDNLDEFNCLFCYCPLYFMGQECGGDYEYSATTVKMCTKCIVPHNGDKGYETVLKKLKVEFSRS